MVLSPFDEQLESQAGGGGTSVLAQIREAERQRRIAEEAARFREAERQQAAEAARRAEAARQAGLARQAEVARQLAAFREAQRQQELQREQQAEAARRAELARQAAIAAEQARFREEQRRQEQERARQAEAARRTEAARQVQLQVERDRLRAIERERELEQQRVEARQAEARALERARQDELDRQREQARLRAKERELQLEREQEQIRQRERLEPEAPVAPARAPGLEEAGARLLEDTPARRAGAAATRDAFRAERELRDRNDALRRAFAAVPGGPENLATIEALVDASERSIGGLSAAEERLFAAGLAQDEAAAAAGAASVLPELAGRTPGEAAALIRQRAGEIERGLEAHDLFLEERRRRSANDPVRRRLLETPGGEALIATLELAGEAADGALNNGRTTLERSRFGGAEDDDALGAERTLSERNAARRRAFGVLEDGERTLAAVELLAANGDGRPANPRALSAEEEERLFEAQLAIEEAAAVNGAPSVLREVQAMLAEQDAAEQEALIQEIAAKIPGGTESVADFRREQALKEENDARRREIAALPNGRALLDAEDARFRPSVTDEEIGTQGSVFQGFSTPTEILGVPVTVNRALVDIQLKALRTGDLTSADEALIARAPEGEWERARDLGLELYGSGASRRTNWQRAFKLATGEEPPDSTRGARDAVEGAFLLASGFGFLDAVYNGLFDPEREGVVLLDRTTAKDADELERLLSQTFDSNEDFVRSASALGIRTYFQPDPSGPGTAIEQSLRDAPVVGAPLAEVVDVVASPIGILTLIYAGPAALAESVVEPLAFSVGVDTLTALGLPESVAEEILAGVLPLEGALDALETWASRPAASANDRWFVAPVQLTPQLEPISPQQGSGFQQGGAGAGRGGGGGSSF